MKRKEVETTQAVIAEIRELVRGLIKGDSFTLILEKGTVLALDETIEVTDRVIKLYDAVKK